MAEIFIGTEAVAEGVVTRHELARWYRPFFPNVHAPRGYRLTLHDRATGAWLWSKRQGIVTGAAASAIYGAEWVDANTPMDLIYDCARPPAGVVTRNERIGADENTSEAAMPIATPTRAAFDLGRYQERGKAIARMDALMRVTSFSNEEVLLLAKRYRGARGVKELKDRLPLVDSGAASPRDKDRAARLHGASRHQGGPARRHRSSGMGCDGLPWLAAVDQFAGVMT